MATTSTATMRERFEALLSPDRVIDHPLERRLYSRDGSIAMGDAGLVVLPETTAEVVDCVRLARELDLPVVPRGSGTGLCGGAVPLDGAIVLSVARMTRILDVDPAVPCARVEPGVLNLDLSVAVRHLGLHYAPDPSSQQACSIGGNVATNAGGPHCLASGVTAQHVLGMEIVLADGEVLRLGGPAPDPPGYDLRGFVVGGEGTLGVVTEVTVRLMRTPRHVRTMLLDFTSVRAAGEAVGGIIGGGVIPAAMEMMDQRMTVAVEAFVHADLPVDAAAMLLVEVDGTEAEVAAHTAVVERVGAETGARRVRVARDAAEAALFWKARKSAFGAVARVAPNYYLHDCVVPRTRLVEILERIYEIGDEFELVIMNVFHAGDGNLHPLIAFDRRDAAQVERVHAAGKAIIEACVAVGGVLSGEHGIGLEKRDFMPLTFSDVDLAAQACAREAFDPDGRMNPAKVLPVGSRCGELVLDAGSLPDGTWL
ncbi:MAG: FAD-binding oxidoreductase [Thermoleophilia bacterium]